jgi:hypothetical protein
LTLGEVIEAEGRNAATHVLRGRIQDIDVKVGSVTSSIDELTVKMRNLQDRRRATEIKDFFVAHYVRFANELDVRVSDDASLRSMNASRARGSEGPRGLAAYYYAFIHTAHKFGSSAFCPIVIDAPNQQGQDANHLPAIITFLVKSRPRDSQLILAVEETAGVDETDAHVVSVGETKDQLLSEAHFAR